MIYLNQLMSYYVILRGFYFKNFASAKFRENIPSQEIQDLQDLLHVRITSF